MKPLTPEEKLFAVIQSGAQGTHAARFRLRMLSPKALLARLKEAMTHPRVDLARINRALAVLMGLLVVAGGLNPLLFRPDEERVMAQAMQQVELFSIEPPLEGFKPSETYQKLLADQNPFHLIEPAQAPTSPEPALPTVPQAAQLLEDFRLVGISWGDEPIAMIEQASQQRTYFVKAGDLLAPFTVKAVLQDRVILAVDSQELELF